MASDRHQLYSFVALIALLLFPAVSLAKEFIVGDEAGWTINFDYQKWAAGKDFMVGDKLVFKYPVGAHTVLKVNATNFQACNKEPLDGNVLGTGNDVITLATPGKKWYICGVAQHCAAAGQKLAVNVADLSAQSPAPTGTTPGAQAPSSANGIMPSGHLALMAAIIGVATMMML
ncbi:hypothetical protein ACLOJK_005706 [Asimina triloba]